MTGWHDDPIPATLLVLASARSTRRGRMSALDGLYQESLAQIKTATADQPLRATTHARLAWLVSGGSSPRSHACWRASRRACGSRRSPGPGVPSMSVGACAARSTIRASGSGWRRSAAGWYGAHPSADWPACHDRTHRVGLTTGVTDTTGGPNPNLSAHEPRIGRAGQGVRVGRCTHERHLPAIPCTIALR